MNIKENFKAKRSIINGEDTVVAQATGDDSVTHFDPIDVNTDIDETIALSGDDVDLKTPSHTFYTDMFDPILNAYEYLEGDGRDEPNFSIHEVARLAITLHSLMVDHNVNTVRGIKSKKTWSKEDLGIFIRNLFETLLDFLDDGEDSVSDKSAIIQ